MLFETSCQWEGRTTADGIAVLTGDLGSEFWIFERIGKDAIWNETKSSTLQTAVSEAGSEEKLDE